MKNITRFSLTQLQVAKSFVSKGKYYEHSDKDLAIEYYKDSIQLLLNSTKAEIQHARAAMRLNHMLAIKFYKEALRLMLDQRKEHDEKLRSLMRLNHLLVTKLKGCQKQFQ